MRHFAATTPQKKLFARTSVRTGRLAIFLAGFLTLSLAPSANAARRGPPRTAPTTQVTPRTDPQAAPQALAAGMEVELSPEDIAGMARQFDWATLGNIFPRMRGGRKLPGGFSLPTLDRYLDDPSHFDSLPTRLQQRLSQGLTPPPSIFTESTRPVLTLPPPLQIQPQLRAQSQVRPRRTQTPPAQLPTQPQEQRQVQPPAEAPILSGGLWLSPETITAREQADRRQAIDTYWTEIRTRWRALLEPVKRRLVRFENLSPEERVRIFIDYTMPKEALATFNLLQHSPLLSLELQAFWSSLAVHRDMQEQFEFTHRSPVSLPQALGDLNRILHLAGKITADELSGSAPSQDPYAFLRKHASVHLHVTFDTPVIEAAWIYNLAMMLRLSHPDISLYDGVSQVSVGLPEAKGLLRVVDPHHIEFRVILQSPAQTVQEFSELLDPNQAPEWAREIFSAPHLERLLETMAAQVPASHYSESHMQIVAFGWAKAIRRLNIPREQTEALIPVLESWYPRLPGSSFTKGVVEALFMALHEYAPRRAVEVRDKIFRERTFEEKEAISHILLGGSLEGPSGWVRPSGALPLGVSVGENPAAVKLRKGLTRELHDRWAINLLPLTRESDLPLVRSVFEALSVDEGFNFINRMVMDGDPRIRELCWQQVGAGGYLGIAVAWQLWRTGGLGVRERLVPFLRESVALRKRVGATIFGAETEVQDHLAEFLPDFLVGEKPDSIAFSVAMEVSKSVALSTGMQAAIVEFLASNWPARQRRIAYALLRGLLGKPLEVSTLQALNALTPRQLDRMIPRLQKMGASLEARAVILRRLSAEQARSRALCNRLLTEP